MANRAAGKGYENEDNYSNIRFNFQGIENIHVMRNSLQKLLEGISLCVYQSCYFCSKHIFYKVHMINIPYRVLLGEIIYKVF